MTKQNQPEPSVQSIKKAFLTTQRSSLRALQHVREQTVQRICAVPESYKVLAAGSGNVLQIVKKVALVQFLAVCETKVVSRQLTACQQRAA